MLEMEKVFAGYGKTMVLHDVTLAFEQGKVTTLVGPNGCGKSTLLKTLFGYLPIMSGRIVVDGKDLTTMNGNDTAKKIAYLTQGRATPDMTVYQLVLHGRFPHLHYPRRYTKQDKKLALDAMERVGIASLADMPLSRLSGGMRQNVYIAMALAQDTEYILLDEPTTYLDISHQLSLMKLLRTLAKDGKGIVAVMHDLPMAFTYSDDIALLHEGKVAANASPQSVSDSTAFKEVFGVSLQQDVSKKLFHLDLEK